MPKKYDIDHSCEDTALEPDQNGLALTKILPEDDSGSVKIKNGNSKKEKQQVTFFQLFKYADGLDKTLMAFGALGGLMQAVGMQILPVLIFDVINKFSIIQTGNSTSDLDPQDVIDLIPVATYPICIVIVVDLVFAFMCVCLWSYSAERQTQKVRKLAFHRILHMHIGWFDRHLGGELNSRLAEDASRYQNGIGDKVGLVIHWFCMFVVAFIFAMIISWKVTLVTLATIPVVIGAAVLSGWSARVSAEMEGNAYAKAGSVAEEALSNIRIVAAFGGEEAEGSSYSDLLAESRKVAVKSGAITALSQGLSWLIIFSIAALIYWYGGNLVEKDHLQPGSIFMIFMMMVSGSRSLAFAAPNLEAINAAQSSAYALYRIIDEKSECDSSLDVGKKPNPNDIKGEVSFEGVHFAYPQRKDIQILKGLSMTIRPGQSAALVGPSGCGKSTTIQLLQRLYDPGKGHVKIDGHSVTDVNLRWLRDQIGVVSQEPILFATTIAENIMFGREGCTMDEVFKASKEASAHAFIKNLPDGYETVLNEQGTQLSRGEKQRISLARALIRSPKILLLDECTSALDTESEVVVQQALDKASAGRTTVIIAHRLSTVRDCDILFVINNGVVEEFGNHNELMAKQGLYQLLVSNQVGDEEKREQVEDLTVLERTHSNLDRYKYSVEGFSNQNRTSSTTSLKRTISEASITSRERALSKTSITGVFMEGPIANLELTTVDEDEYPEVAWSRLLKMNTPEWPYMTVGGIASIASGLVWPTFAYFFGLTVEALVIPGMNSHPDRSVLQTAVYALATLVLGLIAGFIQFTMGFAFKFSGEGLTHRMRVLAFNTMMRQEIGWFDEESNQVGTLTSKLANEASRVKMATGPALSALLQATSTAIFASVLAITLSWQLGLAMLPLIPLGAAVTIAQGYFNKSFAVKSQEAIEASGKIASEAMDKIRTVIALNKEDYFMAKYQLNFDNMMNAARKRAVIMGTTWGMMWFVSGMNYVIAVGLGLYLVAYEKIEFHNIYTVLAVSVLASLELGRANAYAPEFTSAKAAASRLFALFDRKSKLDPLDPSGDKPGSCKGELSLNIVDFFYPTRPTIQVLHSLSLNATRGQSLALVGPSGGGKSAIIQLLERFYDVKRGSVELDGTDVRRLNVSWLRRQMAIVTQEPILFAKTIKENIAYGDTSRDVPFEDILEAAKAANIHNFITTLPLGYDTNVGGKGTQLSGGQKQRVSIARALVRNPKILILDDATSALDSESEKVVEEALQLARLGRTSIVVSHRLSSIVNASQILYVDKGKILERGTHEELMSKRNHYYGLQMASLGHKSE